MTKNTLQNIPRTAIVGVVKIYKYCISPLLPPSCRFTPSCSTYMIQAVEKHGVLRGVVLGVWRILRCHPFSKGGYDPVK